MSIGNLYLAMNEISYTIQLNFYFTILLNFNFKMNYFIAILYFTVI